jgi:uncharacterized membrane protein
MRKGQYVGVVGVGQLLFAVGFAVVGAIGLAVHEFVLSQEPVPREIPWRETLACLNGALLLLTGLGLLIRRAARPCALILTAFLALWVLALQLPRAVAHPSVEANWLGVGEDMTLVTGGWIICCALAGRYHASVPVARALFGLALIPIGLSHWFYLKGAAELIPAWFPLRVPLTQFTGAAHIAAGLAILFGIVPRLAATLEAVQESIFTLVCWLTAVIATPGNLEDWENLFISTALSAAAWALAGSYRRASGGPGS